MYPEPKHSPIVPAYGAGALADLAAQARSRQVEISAALGLWLGAGQ